MAVSGERVFRAVMTRSLRRRDFDGDFATVTVVADGLTLKGEKRGFLHVPFERVEGARVGFTEAKYGLIYEAKVWLDGEKAPLQLFPYGGEEQHRYGTAMRGLASALHERGRISRIRRGTSLFEALIGPMLMAPVVLAALAAATISADPPVWWHFIVIPLIPALVLAALLYRMVTRHWPRPIASLAELEKQLP